MPEEEIPKTTYEPNVAVMDESEVPKKWHSEIENRIKKRLILTRVNTYSHG